MRKTKIACAAWLAILATCVILTGCSKAWYQTRDIKRLDALSIQQPSEFLRLSDLINPCFDGKAKSDTVIQVGQADTTVVFGGGNITAIPGDTWQGIKINKYPFWFGDTDTYKGSFGDFFFLDKDGTLSQNPLDTLGGVGDIFDIGLANLETGLAQNPYGIPATITKTITIRITTKITIHDTIPDTRALANLQAQINDCSAAQIADQTKLADALATSKHRLWWVIGLAALITVFIAIKIYIFFTGGGIASIVKKVV